MGHFSFCFTLSFRLRMLNSIWKVKTNSQFVTTLLKFIVKTKVCKCNLGKLYARYGQFDRLIKQKITNVYKFKNEFTLLDNSITNVRENSFFFFHNCSAMRFIICLNVNKQNGGIWRGRRRILVHIKNHLCIRKKL